MSDILRVENLHVTYQTRFGEIKAVDGVTFGLREGERLGLVGESGSGKSTLALAVMGLIKPPGMIDSGRVLVGGRDILRATPDEMRRIRLAKVALIPQGAMNSLNPVRRVRDQMIDGFRAHDPSISKRAEEDRVRELLAWVGLRREVAGSYPHELSGGMKQRVCIAIGVSLSPSVIIADEPTSALDVVVQRQVMETLENVQNRLGVAIILIGHDMGLMAQFVERVAVMYGGMVAEIGSVRQVFKNPAHPYTQLLIGSLPSFGKKGSFRKMPSQQPFSSLDLRQGCLFSPRCPSVMEHCRKVIPEWFEVEPGHWAACHLYGGDRVGAARSS